MPQPLRRLALAAVCSSVLACTTFARPTPCAAQASSRKVAKSSSDSDADARALFQQGRDAYEAGAFDRALELFQQAFALSKRPQLLHNIGAAADRLRMDREALEAYRRFLAEVPDADNRAAVESRIAVLEASIARTEARTEALVPTPAQTAQAAQPTTTQASPAHGPKAATARDDDAGSSVLSSFWLWAGVSVVAIAGVIVGVAASSSSETSVGAPPVVDGATRVIEL